MLSWWNLLEERSRKTCQEDVRW